MKTLRAKLFLSVSVIFLIVAFMNFLLPYIYIKKDINRVSVYMNQHLEQAQNKLLHISSFLISSYLINSGTQLEAMSEIVEERIGEEKANSWIEASKIASYSPEIAFVQISDIDESTIVVAPEGAKFYESLWAPFEQGMLWIKISENQAIFLAIPIPAENYLLFDRKDLNRMLTNDVLHDQIERAIEFLEKGNIPEFRPFKKPDRSSFSNPDSVVQLYNFLLSRKRDWIKKNTLIQELAKWQNQSPVPSGILNIQDEVGESLFSQEVFFKQPFIQNVKTQVKKNTPSLVLRSNLKEKDLDLVSAVQIDEKQIIGLGFSISNLIKEISRLIQRPILIFRNHEFLIGYNSQGKSISYEEIKKSKSSQKEVVFEGEKYIPYHMDIDSLNLTVLASAKQSNSLMRFLGNLRDQLIEKISLILVAAALISLVLALILLGRISKKITKPIAMLAHASEEIGEGKYEGVELPNVESRSDEIAILSHAFEGMVVSLKDREKVRGILNKVVSKEIAEEILKKDVKLIGEERVVTMLFSDIRGFTRFSQAFTPHDLISLLNDYMTRMCRIVDTTKGVVDKFVGDEIMALYGAPLPLENQAFFAIESALKMMHHLRQWNGEREKNGEPTFEIGIGIHTGLVFSGNIGAENRLNYTVIGSNVNLASRLCSIAEPMQIIVSEETWNQPGVKEKFKFKQLASLQLRGIDRPVVAYEVIEEGFDLSLKQ